MKTRGSDFNLLRNRERVINFDAEIPDRGFHFRGADCRAAMDQRGLRAAERVRTEDVRVQAGARNPFRDKPRVLTRCYGFAGPSPAGKQKLTGLLAGRLEVIIDGLSGLLSQFKTDGTAGLSLANSRACKRVAIGCNVFNLHTNDIAAPELAVDREVEHRQIAGPVFHLELGPDRPDVPCQ
jgi:hypothetical protein